MVGLFAGAACKQPIAEVECSTQTKCKGGFKCEKEDGSGPVTKLGEAGTCVKDPCAITVGCEEPVHSQPPNESCINDQVRVCDLHDPHKFCKCEGTGIHESAGTTDKTPTTTD